MYSIPEISSGLTKSSPKDTVLTWDTRCTDTLLQFLRNLKLNLNFIKKLYQLLMQAVCSMIQIYSLAPNSAHTVFFYVHFIHWNFALLHILQNSVHLERMSLNLTYFAVSYSDYNAWNCFFYTLNATCFVHFLMQTTSQSTAAKENSRMSTNAYPLQKTRKEFVFLIT